MIQEVMSMEDTENNTGGITGWFLGLNNKSTNDRHRLTAKRPGPATTPDTTNNDVLDESFEEDTSWSPTKGESDGLWNQQLGDHLAENRAVVNSRSKHQRITKLQEKRSTNTKPAAVSPHPMSKSLFRVGTSQPHHKRPAETNNHDESPEEKRMRLEEDSKQSGTVMISCVAVVAMIAAMALAWRRRRA